MKLNPTLRDDADVMKIVIALENRSSTDAIPLIHTLANICFAMGQAEGTKTACDTFERLVKGT